ncbi:hypothetical protein HYH03_005959 [Edaphochlamys debaryana]|nr:hypothetical protein HYH03_005959 [Edaphochlamys debaryana]|eukprot:KAG2496037.1 hypothetical protein HYH03_005959 [Edaphochlamys debaryana]
MGPVTGFFFTVAPAATGSSKAGGASGGVTVRRYDPAQELLVELLEDEAERYALGVRRYDFDAGLAPYNLHAWRQWVALTDRLDAEVIAALQPLGGSICTATEASNAECDAEAGPESAAEARLREQLREGREARARAAAAAAGAGDTAAGTSVGADSASGSGSAMEVDAGSTAVTPGSAPAPASTPGQGDGGAAEGPTGGGGAGNKGPGRCFYTALSRLIKKEGLTPAQLTAANLDRTAQLEAAAGRWGGDACRLVGEAQFAFAAFVFGQSMQGFRQWRSLVSLFLNCERGPLSPALAPAFAAFLSTLRAQLSLSLSDASSGTRPGEPLGPGGPAGGPAVGLWAQGSALVEEVLLAGGGRDCFLRAHLATFFEVLREAGPGGVDPALADQAQQLRAVLARAVGWHFDGLQELGNSDDEDGPVVVELPEGAELPE